MLQRKSPRSTKDVDQAVVDQSSQKQYQTVKLLNLPGQHAPKTRPWTSGDQKAHRGVRYGVPSSAHKQDDGGIEGIQLAVEKTERLVQLWL